MSLPPLTARLLAAYVRRQEGAAEVLHDALVEKGLPPLPNTTDPELRLEATLAVLEATVQTSIGCASTRRVLGRFREELPKETAPSDALGALDEATGASVPPAIRHRVFCAWRECERRQNSGPAARVAWAVWMLTREMPLVALRTLRALDPNELHGQIDLVATSLEA